MKLLILTFLSSIVLSAQEKKSYTLDQAIDYALENAYAIKNATNDISSAEKKVWETTTIGLPQINASFDYQNYLKQPVSLLPAAAFDNTESVIDVVNDYFDANQTNFDVESPDGFIPLAFGTKQNINATVTLTQLLFDGSYLIGLQSAKTYLQISESAKEKTEFSVKQSVINAYANVLLVEENINILEKNKTVLEKNLNETLKIIENGFAEEQDGEQLQLTLSAINNELNRVNRYKSTAYKMFNVALGIDVDSEVTLTETLEELLLSNLNLELTKTNFTVENHIDYKIAETSRKSQELVMKYEKSKALPTLSAFVNYGTTANNDDFKFFKNDQKWFDSSILGVSLNVPIFSSLKRDSRTQQAKIELEKAERQLTETEQQLKVAFLDAQNNYQYSIDSYQTSKENLALAERIEKKENIKFFEGISSSFDLSNAQNQLYTQQQEYLQSIYDLITTKSVLENALNIK
ncbi:transporter [Urechidicola croceus]|uniref:Transporter n=1 Tax=Urechidicola croceus TaxID=1850246 RepID=A0A1D8PBZ7_9FLAO|nr:transporter [Urechidicola croceus]